MKIDIRTEAAKYYDSNPGFLCGKKAAASYCRLKDQEKGFTRSSYHLVEPERSDSDTITVSDGTVYDHNEYDLRNSVMTIGSDNQARPEGYGTSCQKTSHPTA